MIAKIPTKTGTAAATNPPKMKINRISVMGSAIDSARTRSDCSRWLKAVPTIDPPANSACAPWSSSRGSISAVFAS